MAVELRCPDCRAKLRLKAAPEEGTEIECPKCGTVFPAPKPEGDEGDDAPQKKKDAGDKDEKGEGAGKDGGEKKGDKKDKKAAKGGQPAGPRRRKAKKRESSKTAMIAVIAAGALMLICMTAVLIWYFTRTSKATEMLYYAPEDAQTAVGLNLGHAQKYPEFYKQFKTFRDQSDFKEPGEAIGKAAGTDMDGLVEYVVKADSISNGWSMIFRTKAEFDDSSLGKIPGGEKRTLNGKTYYLAPILSGGQRAQVFAPTNRLIVVCPESMKEPVFRKILNGHADSKEKTLGVRMGALGKRVTRGTFWSMVVFDNEEKAPTAPPQGSGGTTSTGSEDPKTQLAKTVAETVNGAQGFGFKASLGSREVRFELIVWYKDGEKASEISRKWKESELGKGDEGNPPRWFKDETSGLGDKKVAAQLLSNLGFGSSGELFYAKTAVSTVDLQQSVGNALGKVTGQQRKAPGGGGMPGGPGGPGQTPGPGQMPGAPGGPPRPPGRRRRVWGRR